MTSKFGKIEKIMVGLLFLYSAYASYYFLYLIYDIIDYGFAKVVFFAFCLVFLSLFLYISSKNIWHIIFVFYIIVVVSFLYFTKHRDLNRLNLIFVELTSRDPSLPTQLTLESIKNELPKYYRWSYKRTDEKSFELYYLESSNLMQRKFPEDNGWCFVKKKWDEFEWFNEKKYKLP